jgi:hypothetical protein
MEKQNKTNQQSTWALGLQSRVSFLDFLKYVHWRKPVFIKFWLYDHQLLGDMINM